VVAVAQSTGGGGVSSSAPGSAGAVSADSPSGAGGGSGASAPGAPCAASVAMTGQRLPPVIIAYNPSQTFCCAVSRKGAKGQLI